MHAVSEKSAIRESFLSKRRSLDPHRRAAADRTICAILRDLLRTGRRPGRPALAAVRRTVAGYVPTNGEPGGTDLPEALRGYHDRVLLPVLRSDLDLDWAEYTGPGCLQPARWRLCEPAGPRLGADEVTTASVLVVPAVAVDRSGVRLGRGGGSYDRALARVPPRTLVVALLYDGELIDRLPAEPHDRRVAAVIAPDSGFRHLDPTL
jgi:5-formyltetrahydrofolate cyclo-ligase